MGLSSGYEMQFFLGKNEKCLELPEMARTLTRKCFKNVALPPQTFDGV
jgi:hypothetical protein